MEPFGASKLSLRFDLGRSQLRFVLVAVASLVGGLTLVHAKLPAPSDEAKAKAAEAAAKTAWSNKVADFQLCKAQDRVAAKAVADMKRAGKDVKPATATPPCTDPGPFVYTPQAPAAATPAAAAPAVAAATPAAAAPAKK